MKKNLLALFAMIVASSAAFAQVTPPTTAYVAGTKHNMSVTGTGVQSNSTQICVYCHTPHGAIDPTEAAGSVRLWNHELSTNDYSAGKRTGQQITTTDGGVPATVMCLSCHDGTVAVNALHNPPSDITGALTFTDPADGGMVGGFLKTDASGNAYSLGTNMEIQHPVGIPYPVSGVTTGTSNSTGAHVTLADATTHKVAYNGNTLSLYQHPSDATGGWWLECRTCHDVHGKTASTINGGKSLLNVSNAGSGLCITCHNSK